VRWRALHVPCAQVCGMWSRVGLPVTIALYLLWTVVPCIGCGHAYTPPCLKLMELQQRPLVLNHLYCSANALPTGSEDNTCRLWRPSGECLAVLSHPGCVWAAAWLPPAGTGTPDLVTGCSDSIGRVFTVDPARQVGRQRTLSAAVDLPCSAASTPSRCQQEPAIETCITPPCSCRCAVA
jgi:hypothetical protein